ncbi:MAG TPA: hypothetical protein PLD20_34805 [Blastocatellia bacterium]|nr:hypothetical protein [Blastocatellia bacterium]HMV86948.1 hypothetical protein [Blastocatellia bacterium]HMZ23147.1 hypothetical protein [Blastocatellia bacterium]HNG33711.1 hypothetical protein [Blastocatellia bacterium]
MFTSQLRLSRKTLLSVLFVLLSLPILGVAQLSEAINQDSRMSFEFKDASLKAVLKNLGKQLDVDVVYENSVKDLNVTFRRTDVTMETMIKEILTVNHLQARVTDAKHVVIFADTEENRLRYESYTAWPK